MASFISGGSYYRSKGYNPYTSQGGYVNELKKRQQDALKLEYYAKEDDWQNGYLSDEDYLNALQYYKNNADVTALQGLNLTDKIRDTKERITENRIDTLAQRGGIDNMIDAVNYYKKKLETINPSNTNYYDVMSKYMGYQQRVRTETRQLKFMDIMMQGGGDQQKMDVLYDLYLDANNNNDIQQAQTFYSQMLNLQAKIDRAAASASRSAGYANKQEATNDYYNTRNLIETLQREGNYTQAVIETAKLKERMIDAYNKGADIAGYLTGLDEKMSDYDFISKADPNFIMALETWNGEKNPSYDKTYDTDISKQVPLYTINNNKWDMVFDSSKNTFTPMEKTVQVAVDPNGQPVYDFEASKNVMVDPYGNKVIGNIVEKIYDDGTHKPYKYKYNYDLNKMEYFDPDTGAKMNQPPMEIPEIKNGKKTNKTFTVVTDKNTGRNKYFTSGDPNKPNEAYSYLNELKSLQSLNADKKIPKEWENIGGITTGVQVGKVEEQPWWQKAAQGVAGVLDRLFYKGTAKEAGDVSGLSKALIPDKSTTKALTGDKQKNNNLPKPTITPTPVPTPTKQTYKPPKDLIKYTGKQSQITKAKKENKPIGIGYFG